MSDSPDPPADIDRPPRCRSERERELLRRMCIRARVDFSEWECARLLTEFKRNLTQRQWVWLRENPKINGPEDALRSLITIGFENRRFKRMRLRGRGRDRIWAEPRQQARMNTLLATDPDASASRFGPRKVGPGSKPNAKPKSKTREEPAPEPDRTLRTRFKRR